MSTMSPITAADMEERNDPRLQIPIKPEHLKYLTEGIKIAIQVVGGNSKLEGVDTVFGIGKDTPPKGPGAKLMRSYFKEILNKRMGATFTRRENGTVWYAADFGDGPSNAPRGVYKMDLPPSFFNEMILEKAFTTKPTAPNDVSPPRNIFEFRITQTKVPLKIEFTARPDVSNINDGYPKSFSNVRITRIEE